jgi:inositol phosphorylceramide synthase catalytic subunit
MNEVNYKKIFLFGEVGNLWYLPIILSISYLLLSHFLLEITVDKIILVALILTCYFYSETSRKFILGFSIFIIYWILYDFMKAFPNYNYNEVHIADLYYFEKEFFGIWYDGSKIILNEYFVNHNSIVPDVVTSLFYLCWIPLPLAFAFYLFRKNKNQFLVFSFAFLITNIIGFIIYYLYPAAPPWYVMDYGFDFYANAQGSAAGLLRFDELINIPLFEMMYIKGSNVFAAVPSLHCSYPLLVFYYGIKFKCGMWNILFFLIMTGIWFAAVYLNHHYVIDVIAGILVAAAGIFFLELFLKMNFIKKNISGFSSKLEK